MMNNSKKIALCGISAALGSIILSLILSAPTGKLSLFALSSVAIMIPLAKKLYSYAALTVLATSLAGFLTGGLTVFLPYILIFGVHPLINALLEKMLFKKGKTVIKILIKLVYFNAMLYLLYSFAYLTQLFVIEIDFFILAVVVSILFIPYDFLMLALQKRAQAFMTRYIKY